MRSSVKPRIWLEFGAKHCLDCKSEDCTVTVYRSITDVENLRRLITLDSGDVIPGFQAAVAEIFANSQFKEQ